MSGSLPHVTLQGVPGPSLSVGYVHIEPSCTSNLLILCKQDGEMAVLSLCIRRRFWMGYFSILFSFQFCLNFRTESLMYRLMHTIKLPNTPLVQDGLDYPFILSAFIFNNYSNYIMDSNNFIQNHSQKKTRCVFALLVFGMSRFALCEINISVVSGSEFLSKRASVGQ